jgi:hypothetical protein
LGTLAGQSKRRFEIFSSPQNSKGRSRGPSF